MNKNPFQGDDEDPFSGARDEETGEIKREAPSTSKAEEPKKQSFGQAFAAARKAGDKTFMFGGKKYTTETKGEAKKPTATPKAEPPKATTAPKTEAPKAYEPTRMTPAEKLRKLRAELPEQKKPDIKPDAAPEKGSPLDKARRLVRGLRVPERTSYKSGGSVSASRRADGCATKGKTKGKMV